MRHPIKDYLLNYSYISQGILEVRGIEENNCPNVILNAVKNLHSLVNKDPSQSLRACPRAQRRNDRMVPPWDILLFPYPLAEEIAYFNKELK